MRKSEDQKTSQICIPNLLTTGASPSLAHMSYALNVRGPLCYHTFSVLGHLEQLAHLLTIEGLQNLPNYPNCGSICLFVS